MISDYLDQLADALSFDRALAWRVRREFEEHLREAIAADQTGDPREAERRAIAACGDPYLISAEFVAVSLARRTKRLGLSVILLVGGIFLAMKARIAWYAAMQWDLAENMRAVAATVGAIDRYAFYASIILGAVGWACTGRASSDVLARRDDGRRLRRLCLVSSVATAAVFVSVISDAVLTALRLATCASSTTVFFVPILSVLIEIAGAGALIVLICDLAQRTSADENRSARVRPG